jgi:hypothetical protein
MTDEKKSYRVTDRRHTSEASESPDSSEESTTTPASPSAVADEPRSRAEAPGEAPSADFLGFIVSLGAQASVLLAGGEGAPPDLKGAKWMISILEMLHDKTEGRRSAEETETLEALLFELRLAYVKRAQSGGA